MTGYACGEQADESFFVTLEIKSYNSRFLEIFVFVQPPNTALENEVRKAVRDVCARGRVEVALKITESARSPEVCVNYEAAAAYTRAAAELRPGELLPLSTLLSLEGVLQRARPEASAAPVRPLLAATFERFNAERLREGESARRAICDYVSILNTQSARIEELAGTVGQLIKTNITARFKELLGDAVDEQRVLAETALLIMKWTIAEETSRLRSHLQAFSDTLNTGGPTAKKLEFLCQEMNREVNTIGSKTPLLEISRAVVECKEALENIREQLRNVE